MFEGVRIDDVLKSVVGVGFLLAGLVFYGPKALGRFGGAELLKAAPTAAESAEHELALRMEAELSRLDVMNIRANEGTLIVTLFDSKVGPWTEDELVKLVEITFYPADLAREAGLSISTRMWTRSEALGVDGTPVDVYLHVETLTCPQNVVDDYDGGNAGRIILRCQTSRGGGLKIDSEDISWAGRGS